MSEAAKFIQRNNRDIFISWTSEPDTLQHSRSRIREEHIKNFMCTLKTDNLELYTTLKDLLTSKGGYFCSFYPRREIDRPVKLKPEFTHQHDELQNSYDEKIQRGQSLIEQLKFLGFNCASIVHPPVPKDPEDWYEKIGEVKYTQARIEILCAETDPLYKEMKADGLVDKYMTRRFNRQNCD